MPKLGGKTTRRPAKPPTEAGFVPAPPPTKIPYLGPGISTKNSARGAGKTRKWTGA